MLRLVKLLLILGTAAALFLAARLLVSPLHSEPTGASGYGVGPAPDVTVPAAQKPDSIAGASAARDVFRMTRSAAAVRYDPRLPEGAAPPPPRPRPTLMLVGILNGAEPAALLDGLPGVEGTRVMRVGDRAGEFLIRRITKDSVVVSSRDTTWSFRVRNLP